MGTRMKLRGNSTFNLKTLLKHGLQNILPDFEQRKKMWGSKKIIKRLLHQESWKNMFSMFQTLKFGKIRFETTFES
jgi:hypothetical protein